MSSGSLEILSSFVDGEPVDPDVLTRALLSPGGREALLDFARLRAAVAADESRPGKPFYDAIARALDGALRVPNHRRRPWRPLAAAAVLALAVFGIVDLGLRLGGRGAERPPRPARVLQFEPGVDWNANLR